MFTVSFALLTLSFVSLTQARCLGFRAFRVWGLGFRGLIGLIGFMGFRV